MENKTPKTRTRQAKHEYGLQGMAADMQKAEAELFNPLQLSMLRRQRQAAEQIAQYDCTAPTKVINLRGNGLPPPETEPEKQVLEMPEKHTACPLCPAHSLGSLFAHLRGSHGIVPKQPFPFTTLEACQFCGKDAQYVTSSGYFCCSHRSTDCDAYKKLRAALAAAGQAKAKTK